MSSGAGAIPASFYQRVGKQTRALYGQLTLDAEGAHFRGKRKVVLDFAWPDVEQVAFDDPGRTRANIAALAMFGVLAIGSRRSFSLLTITVKGDQYYFETQWPIGTWRAVAPQIWHDVPAVRGKLAVEGNMIGEQAIAAPTQAAAAEDIPAKIRGLAELRDQGILSTEEFETKKAELLARM